MLFRLADSFTKALSKLTNEEQKAVKLTVFDLQQAPSNPGFKFHRIDQSKDPNFWSVRVNRDIRLVIHKTDASLLIAYVAHHDDAYKWAERRRIDAHPRTGAAQIVEIREYVEEITIPAQAAEASTNFHSPLFLKLSVENLLKIGVPEDWLEDVRNASEDTFLDLADHIPQEAAEILLSYAADGILRLPEARLADVDPFDHPDAMRRFRVMENVAALRRALDYPWDKWALYLHPDQQRLVDGRYSGPARVAGSAGTGKTVVALHRAAHILRQNRQARLLLTTFSSPLSNMLDHKLKRLVREDQNLDHRLSVRPFAGVAKELFTLINGHEPQIAGPEHVSAALSQAADELKITGFTDRFLMSEWRSVIDAWQIDSLAAYARVPRPGRKNRLGGKQRERLWPVFGRVREILRAQLRYTPANVFGEVAAYYKHRKDKPFSHIIVDEAQDLGVPELKMLSAIAPDDQQALFFAGDLGQRIFQEPFSWLGLGIDIRGRSHTLKVNYRTSHQIRQAADRLLPHIMRDMDGIEQDRRATVSVFNGPEPDVLIHVSEEEEIKAIGSAILKALDTGIPPEEIGVFVRSEDELTRARSAVQAAGQTPLDLSDRVEDRTGRLAIGTLHLAKGLEFRQIVVMACDDEVLPDQDRIDTVADEAALDEVYDTERQLFYVACTRAREKLIVSGVKPASEFFADLG